MAQSFNAISTSLNEAERVKSNGKPWTKIDYDRHAKRYNIDASKTEMNVVYVSANGRNEKQIVNDFLHDKMLEVNAKKVQKVQDWNKEHVGKTNPKTGKEYHQKSVDKRQMFPVGEYEKTGKRGTAYDIFKSAIEKGNAKDKDPSATRYRMGVLQQFVVGIGSGEEWQHGPRKTLLEALNSDDPKARKKARNTFENEIYNPWLEKFQAENPSMHVVQAVLHYDESHPHLQVTVLPYMDNGKNGGLGSTSYTGCISNDHPEFKDKKATIGQWYQKEHNDLRDLVAGANSHVRDNGKKMSLAFDPKRPGTHASHRVDKFNTDIKPELQEAQEQLAQVQQDILNTQEQHLKMMDEYAEEEKTAKRRADDAFYANYKDDIAKFDEEKTEQEENEKEWQQNAFDWNNKKQEFLKPFGEFLFDSDRDTFDASVDAEAVADPTDPTTLQDFNSDRPPLSGMPAVMHYATESATNAQELQTINNKVQQQQTHKQKKVKDDGLSF